VRGPISAVWKSFTAGYFYVMSSKFHPLNHLNRPFSPLPALEKDRDLLLDNTFAAVDV